jgi:Rrf2 family protein
MRMSTRGRYALRAMVDLALTESEGPIQQEEIARRQEIPSAYLARLMTQLSRAGLVRGERGPGGGYRLAKPAAEIGAGDIVRAVEGPLRVVLCVDPVTGGACSRQAKCVTTNVWKRVGEAIAAVLDGISLQDMVEDAKALEEKSAGKAV